jgi:hypothetical protein
MQTLYNHDVWTGFSPTSKSEIQGWNGDHPSLGRLATAAGAKIVVDVGVWKGQSTINMAQSMQRAGLDGVVISVDTFLGSPEHWMPSRELFSRQNGLPDLFHTFLSNVMAAGVQDYVVPLPQTSVCAAIILKRYEVHPTVVHIDAAHEYEEVIRDAQEYWDLLQPGGWLVGDDYHLSWPGVIRAAGEFSARVGQPLSIEEPKWILRKPL